MSSVIYIIVVFALMLKAAELSIGQRSDHFDQRLADATDTLRKLAEENADEYGSDARNVGNYLASLTRRLNTRERSSTAHDDETQKRYYWPDQWSPTFPTTYTYRRDVGNSRTVRAKQQKRGFWQNAGYVAAGILIGRDLERSSKSRSQ